MKAEILKVARKTRQVDDVEHHTVKLLALASAVEQESCALNITGNLRLNPKGNLSAMTATS